MKFKYITILFLTVSFSAFTQETKETKKDTSIEGQFDEIYKVSSNYLEYRVISKERYQTLKRNVLDSIKNLEDQISQKENLLASEKEKIKKTKELLSKTQADLVTSIERENSLSFLGFQTSKIKYNFLLWSIIIISISLLFYFIFKFFRSNILTKEAQNNLLEVEQEFEQHRKKSLEREQKLRRQLQDEINKQRKG